MSQGNMLMEAGRFGKNLNSQNLVIYFGKEIDGSSHQYYHDLVSKSLERGCVNFEFDLTATSFISSSGIGSFINLHKIITSAGGELVLTSVSREIQKVLERVKLLDLFKVVEQNDSTELQAFKNLNQSILREYNLLATLNIVTEKILAADKDDVVYPLILGQISNSLGSALSILLRKEGDGQWVLESYSGVRVEALDMLERGMELTLSLPDDQEPLIMPESLPREQWPQAMVKLFPEDDVLTAPLPEMNGVRRMMLFSLAALQDLPYENLIYMIRMYSRICGMALEKRALLAAYQLKTEQLDQALRRLEAMHQSLVEAGKMANLSVIITSLAHHFNNRLVPIVGYAQILRSRHPELSDEVIGKIGKIENAAEEVQKVLDSLIGMARHQNLKLESCSLGAVLNTVHEIFAYKMHEDGVEFHAQFDSQAPELKLDRELIEQAYLALLRQCLINLEQTENPYLKIHLRWAKQMAIIDISHNGRPFRREEENLMMDPFGTMRELDDPHMLALLVVSEIVKSHRGMIEMKQRDGWTMVSVILPGSNGSDEES